MKILVPVDGSEASLRAAEKAAEWMEKDSDVKTTLLYVTTLSGKIRGYMASPSVVHSDSILRRHISFKEEDYNKLSKEEAEPHLEKAAKIFENKGLNVETKVKDVEGNAAEAIADVVKKENFDHVVMGRRGVGAVEYAIMGSVSTKVLLLVDVPVTLVR